MGTCGFYPHRVKNRYRSFNCPEREGRSSGKISPVLVYHRCLDSDTPLWVPVFCAFPDCVLSIVFPSTGLFYLLIRSVDHPQCRTRECYRKSGSSPCSFPEHEESSRRGTIVNGSCMWLFFVLYGSPPPVTTFTGLTSMPMDADGLILPSSME